MKITIQDVVKQLKKVIDPEIGMNIIDIGLIYDIKIIDYIVKIKLSLTTPGCPLQEYFISEIESVLLDLVIDDVEIEIVWDPPWDMSMMDENAKLEFFNSMRPN